MAYNLHWLSIEALEHLPPFLCFITYFLIISFIKTIFLRTCHQWRIQDLAKGGANLPKRAPRPWRAPQAVMAPSRFEGQRGPFEASDAQRAHYELRRPLQVAQRFSSDAQRAPL